MVFVLLLDVWVDLDVLHLLVLDIRVEILVDSILQLVEIVNVLNDPVHSVLESLDEDVVGSDLRSVLLDQVLHMLLSRPEIINDVTQVCIDLIVMSQVLIHVFSFLLQTSDLHSSWSNVTLEVLDLVVKHELELIKLLRLLLVFVNLFLMVSNDLILLDNLLLLSRDLKLKLIDRLLL